MSASDPEHKTQRYRLGELMREVGGMVERPITEQELANARGALVQSLPGSFDTLSSTTVALAALFWEQRPMDAYARLAEAIERAQLPEVQAAARSFFDPSQMQLTLAGDPALVKAQVAPLKLGALTQIPPATGARP